MAQVDRSPGVQVFFPLTPMPTTEDIPRWQDQNPYELGGGLVPEWNLQRAEIGFGTTASASLTPQWQSYDPDPAAFALTSPASAPSIAIVPPRPSGGTTSTAFANLSRILNGQWTTAEKGLDLVEKHLKGYPESLASGVTNPPFIHWRQCDPSRGSEALATVIAMVPLLTSQTVHSNSLLLKSINSQVQRIYTKASKYPLTESLAAFQATILYCIMRTLCASAKVVPMIDEQTVRISQHILAKNVHCIDPDANIQCSSWEGWTTDESIRRTFVIVEALDMLCRARNKLPPVFCSFFCEAILPFPEHVWQASTAEQWVSQYEMWQAYCGDTLRMKHILQWIRGEVSGKEEQLATWFQLIGELGVIILVCARAYVLAAALDNLA